MSKRYSLLFVDDEPWLSEALRLTLESRGYHCTSMVNMTEAVRYLKSNEVDAVITDIMMPAGDDFPEVESSNTGYHFVKEVRAIYPRMGIVCLSVIGDQSKIDTLKRQHVVYIRKGETSLDKAMKLIEAKATGKMSFD